MIFRDRNSNEFNRDDFAGGYNPRQSIKELGYL